MTKKQRAGCALGILTVLISMPMWYWLLYQILVRVNATESMWLVYYVMVPFGLTVTIVGKFAEAIFGDEEPSTSKRGLEQKL